MVNLMSPLVLELVSPDNIFMLPLLPPLPPLLLLMDMEPELETNDSPDLMFIIPPVVPFSAVKPAKISTDPPGPFKDFPA